MKERGAAGSRIDRHLDAFARLLHGPRVARRALIDELRDHLYESAHILEQQGMDPIRAADQAIQDFGSTDHLLHEHKVKLMRRRTAGIAFALLAAAPGLALLWMGILTTGPSAPWTERGEPIVLAWMDVIGVSAMKLAFVAAVIANLVFWLPVWSQVSHRLAGRSHDFAIRACKAGTSTLALALGCIVFYVSLRGLLAPHSIEWLDAFFGIGATAVVLAWLGVMTRSLNRQGRAPLASLLVGSR
jgi:hypothetical protein